MNQNGRHYQECRDGPNQFDNICVWKPMRWNNGKRRRSVRLNLGARQDGNVQGAYTNWPKMTSEKCLSPGFDVKDEWFQRQP